MARVFITGSADGLGLMLGQLLVRDGHEVVLHARSESRAADARAALPGDAEVAIGDVATLAGMRTVAEQAASFGPYEAVVHNVGVGYQQPHRVETEDGLTELWAINVLAPYVLTALIPRPARLVYLSSGMHLGAQDIELEDPQYVQRPWNGAGAYSESKFQDILLAFGVGRRWPEVASNAVGPGWVATRMGGASAPDDLDQAHRTQAWLAVDPAAAGVSGEYLYHREPARLHPAVSDPARQDRLLAVCEEASGIALPA